MSTLSQSSRIIKSLLYTGGLVALTLCSSVLAQEIPQPDGFVTDAANILTDEIELNLERQISTFRDQTTHEIAIVTVPSLQGYSIEEFTYNLATQWGVGTAQNDNGVVFLVAPNDREVWISVGLGLEGPLPDATAFGIIQNEILPEFRADNYPAGIQNGLSGIIRATQDETYRSEIAVTNDGPSLFSMMLLFFFSFAHFIIIAFAQVLGKTKSWWLGGVIGAGIGGIITLVAVNWWFTFPLFIILGFIFDYYVSKTYKEQGKKAWWYSGFSGGSGSGSSSSSSSSFSGGSSSFGGGSFGGGGAGGSW